MSNLYREPSIDASYPVSVHLAKRLLTRRFFRNWPTKTRITYGGHVCQLNEMNSLHRGLTIDAYYRVSVHLGKRFQRRRFLYKLTNQLQEMPMAAMFGNEITNLYRGLVIDGSYLVSVYLTKRFQRRNIYWNWPTRNKSCLLRPCLLTDRDEMRNLYMGPAIYAFYQVSVHLAKRFCTH